MKNIVIFGASGFIGTHMIHELAQSKKFKLFAVDIKEPRAVVSDVTYIDGDVRDLTTFDVEGTVDLIVNLAAIHVTPGHQTHEYYETNILGATEVAAYARRKDVKDIIFTSSISVYGPDEDLKTESSPIAPVSAYGRSKYMSERILGNWLKEEDERRLIICRPAVVFGHQEGGNFTRLAKLIKNGFFVYPGRKDTIKSCIYVKDLIDSLLYAWSLDDKYILFNGAYEERYTIEGIVETFKENHFPKVRTFLLPEFVLRCAAWALMPFSLFGLGIHPERITKLVKSTNVMPTWLIKHKRLKDDALKLALDDWKKESAGKFD